MTNARTISVMNPGLPHSRAPKSTETVDCPVAMTCSSGVTAPVTGDVAGNVTGNVIGNLTPAAATAEHGAGLIGTGVAPTTTRWTENGVIITEFKIDLTGLASVATANDVIGLAAGGVAYIRQNDVAVDGVVFRNELICIEAPVGGDDDVNVVLAASDALEYDGAGGTTYGVNGGDGAAGQTVENLVPAATADHYYYLTAGTGDTAAAYSAGQYIFRTYGHPILT